MKAKIKIPVDKLPDAPDPTLPHKVDEKISFATFFLEEHRKKTDRAEKQRQRRHNA